MKTMCRFALVLAALATSLPAAAQEGPSLHLVSIRGPGGRSVQRALRARLVSEGVQLRDDAPATLSGRVRSQGGRHRLRLTLRGSVSDTLVVRARGVRRLLDRAAARVLEALPSRLAIEPVAIEVSTPAPPAAAAEGPPAEPRPEPAGDAATRGELVSVGVEVGSLSRRLGYRDDIEGALSGYDLPAGLIARVRARWFPLRHVIREAYSGLAVTGELGGAIQLNSTQSNGLSSGTEVFQFRLGLEGELELGPWLRLTPSVQYGEARFAVTRDEALRPSEQIARVPAVHYRYLRPGLAAQFDLPENIDVQVRGGWRSVLDAGDLNSAAWFPRAFTTGFDVGGSVSWQPEPWLRLGVRADYTRYVADLRPEPGDSRIAGGASDEWTEITLEAGLRAP